MTARGDDRSSGSSNKKAKKHKDLHVVMLMASGETEGYKILPMASHLSSGGKSGGGGGGAGRPSSCP
jgi:hypothetical protein